jgi:hypothetical protein
MKPASNGSALVTQRADCQEALVLIRALILSEASI